MKTGKGVVNYFDKAKDSASSAKMKRKLSSLQARRQSENL
jgi:hypothetical protein